VFVTTVGGIVRPARTIRIYGYRSNEVAISIPRDFKSGFIIESVLRRFIRGRRVCGVSLGPHLLGAVPPKWDLGHGPTSITGAKKRIGRRMPKLVRKHLHKLRSVVDDVLGNDFTPRSDPVLDPLVWVDLWDQPLARRQEIRDALSECHDAFDTVPLANIKSFIKDEFKDVSFGVDEVDDNLCKAPRLINARLDLAKGLFGPIGKVVDKFVFGNQRFIKKVPIADRPALIKDRLVRWGNRYFVIDFTSFECSFTREWMECVEFALVDHVVRHWPQIQDFLDHVLKPVVSGRNKIRNFLYKCIVEATRMSGEMFTSSFNGFSNYVLVKFLFGEHLIDFFLEGDDNVGSTDSEVDVSELAKQLGFDIKIDWVDHPGKAGFCGLYFDENLNLVREAGYVLSKFGWTSAIYDGAGSDLRRRLIRSKALSLAYENPRCPVLWKLAQKFLAITSGAKLGSVSKWKHLDEYEKQRLAWAMAGPINLGPPDLKTRMFYSERFGMGIDEQLRLEREIDAIQGLAPMCLPSYNPPFSYCQFYHDFVSSYSFPYCSYIASSLSAFPQDCDDI
jgi:hypothetical protein